MADLAAALIEGRRRRWRGLRSGIGPSTRRKQAELLECDALILGSPNWTGMTGKLKHWMDYTGDLWESGELAGKVGACFTAGWSRSAGTEATLLQLFHLLIGHGMVFVGLAVDGGDARVGLVLWGDRVRRSDGAGPRPGASARPPRRPIRGATEADRR